MRKRFGNVDCVTEIRFFVLGLFHILWMSQDGLHLILLQDVIDRDPVFSG